jgi:hypothetical protein
VFTGDHTHALNDDSVRGVYISAISAAQTQEILAQRNNTDLLYHCSFLKLGFDLVIGWDSLFRTAHA